MLTYCQGLSQFFCQSDLTKASINRKLDCLRIVKDVFEKCGLKLLQGKNKWATVTYSSAGMSLSEQGSVVSNKVMSYNVSTMIKNVNL